MRFLRRALVFVPVFVLGVIVASLPTATFGVNHTDFWAKLNGYNETPEWLGQMREYKATMDKLGSTAGRGSGVARVDGKVACEASMLFVVVRV